jgi:putative membrane protein insertion efficiency factor
MRALVLWLIGFYQKVFFFLPKRCKYIPSCSEYAKEAFNRYGFIKAGMMTVGRVLRCNPWAKGGLDPIK